MISPVKEWTFLEQCPMPHQTCRRNGRQTYLNIALVTTNKPSRRGFARAEGWYSLLSTGARNFHRNGLAELSVVGIQPPRLQRYLTNTAPKETLSPLAAASRAV